MSNNPSTISVAVAFRLSVAVHAIILKRAMRKKMKVSEYLKKKTEYDSVRPH